jgi:hypothetical protein
MAEQLTQRGGASIDPRVLEAVQLALTADREAARERLHEAWRSLSEDDAFHRCVVAHYLADLQPLAIDELKWDQRALDAALSCSPAAFEERMPGVGKSAFLPSLHLNLAASLERVGHVAAAKVQAAAARDQLQSLVQTPLGELTRGAVLRLCERLGA